MTETLARAVVPAAEERARLKEGVHIERSSRRVRTYFAGKLIADSEHVLLVYETKRPPGAARSTDHAVLLTSKSESWVSPVPTASWETWTFVRVETPYGLLIACDDLH